MTVTPSTVRLPSLVTVTSYVMVSSSVYALPSKGWLVVTLFTVRCVSGSSTTTSSSPSKSLPPSKLTVTVLVKPPARMSASVTV